MLSNRVVSFELKQSTAQLPRTSNGAKQGLSSESVCQGSILPQRAFEVSPPQRIMNYYVAKCTFSCSLNELLMNDEIKVTEQKITEVSSRKKYIVKIMFFFYLHEHRKNSKFSVHQYG